MVMSTLVSSRSSALTVQPGAPGWTEGIASNSSAIADGTAGVTRLNGGGIGEPRRSPEVQRPDDFLAALQKPVLVIPSDSK